MSAAQHLWTSKDYARKQPLLTAYVLETICKESPIILTSHEHIWTSLCVPANVGFRDAFSIESSVFQGNRHISSMDLHGNEWYWRARANHDDENEKIKKRKRIKARTRCKLVFVAIERLTLSNLNWIDDIDRDRGFHIQDCCFITFDLFRPDDENGGKWGQETAFIFGQIR